jgi:hypothetical protein
MRWRRAAPIAALLVLAAGCGSSDPPSVDPATTSGTAVGSAAPQALAFSAPAVGGGTIDVSTYAGRAVAFWFWAPY